MPWLDWMNQTESPDENERSVILGIIGTYSIDGREILYDKWVGCRWIRKTDTYIKIRAAFTSAIYLTATGQSFSKTAGYVGCFQWLDSDPRPIKHGPATGSETALRCEWGAQGSPCGSLPHSTSDAQQVSAHTSSHTAHVGLVYHQRIQNGL